MHCNNYYKNTETAPSNL